MKTSRMISIVLALTLLCSISACVGSGGSGVEEEPVPPSDSITDEQTPPAESGTPSPAPPTDSGTDTPAPPTDSVTDDPAPPTDSVTDPPESPPDTITTSPPTDSAKPSPTPTPPTDSGGGGGSSPGLSGSTADILGKLVTEVTAKVQAAGEFMYMSMTTPVSAELSQNTAGLSEADFNSLVTEASSSMAAIGSQAHQIVLIKAKDGSSAGDVKKIIAGRVSGKDGYDSQKWICVWPEISIVVESGSYVLLAASRNDIVDAVLEVFKEMAGSVGDVDVFYEHIG